MTLKLPIEEGVEERAGPVDASPALVRVAEGEGKPLPPSAAHGHQLRRMRRDEGGVRKPALPLPPDLDQVVAIGAVAVKEDDELLRPPGARLEAGAVNCGSHAGRVPWPARDGGQRWKAGRAFPIAAARSSPAAVGHARTGAPSLALTVR